MKDLLLSLGTIVGAVGLYLGIVFLVPKLFRK